MCVTDRHFLHGGAVGDCCLKRGVQSWSPFLGGNKPKNKLGGREYVQVVQIYSREGVIEPSPGYSVLSLFHEDNTNRTTIYDREISYGHSLWFYSYCLHGIDTGKSTLDLVQ